MAMITGYESNHSSLMDRGGKDGDDQARASHNDGCSLAESD